MKALFWDLLTFDRLMTGPVIHIIYWCGLALLVLGGFSVIGGAVGVALREPGIMSWILAVPVLVAGLLVLLVMGLLWRSFCELYVALFRIADDLRVMRAFVEQDHGVGAARPSAAPAPAQTSDIGDKGDADLVSKI
ncbi:DUF4282 domain-containing protein [Brevundimonas sp. 2R-24]|uniref:DUF4282 domain-containing protein n=2 Tax=Peiella sedimenti TaxID=3061083 RepID=A0ABT8SHM1_9CAUL|nr:DUF4282 domain-containing protein [Caulobacteraceae bacterium XZ-24]